jgi:hypothetical protein
MKRLLTLLLLLCSWSAVVAEKNNSAGTISTSGNTVQIINSIGGLSVSFEELIAGSPSTVSVAVQGCMKGGTCEALDSYTTVANAVRAPAIAKVYDYFLVTASWTGGTNPTVSVNATVTTAVNHSGGGGGGGSGTVTSVGLSLPLIFNVTGTPVTTAGILTATLTTQTANFIWAGPASGPAASPTFRALVAADVPDLSAVYVPVARTVAGKALSSNITIACADLSNAGAGCPSTSQAANTFLAAPNGSSGAPAYRLLFGADLPNPSPTSLGGVQSFVAQANKFISSISLTGVPNATQPACTNLSDAAASCNTDTTNAANIGSGTLPAGRLPATTVQTNTNNTYTTGTDDHSGAAHTLPAKKGLTSAIPGTCTVGEEYFATDATAGQNKYLCTATNVFTQQSGGGGGSGTVSSGTAGQPAVYAATGATVSGVDAKTFRSSTYSNEESATGHGDSAYTILATDRFVYTNSAFTASRTWTLPAANAVNPGTALCIVDLQGTVTSSNTLVISRAGTDTINAAVTTVTFNAANDGGCFFSDGSGKWAFNSAPTQVSSGGTGNATITAHGVVLGEGTAATAVAGPDASTTKPLFSAGASADPAFRSIANSDLPGSGGATVNGQSCILGSTCSINLSSFGAGTASATQTFPGGDIFLGGVDPQSSSPYTMVAADVAKFLSFNLGTSFAVTLPQATTAGFGSGAWFVMSNRGAGAVTITPTTSTINGGASITLNQNQGAFIMSDGTNYAAWVSAAPSGSGTVTNVAVTAPLTGGPITTTGTLGCATCTTNAAALTAHVPVVGGGGQATVASGSGAGTAKQLFVSGGASADPAYIDFPDTKVVPVANCNNATAGAGLSLPTTSAPTVVCRTGTNVQTGALQFTASQSAQFQIELPADWDTATNPYVRVNYTQSGSTASQTIAFQVQVGCSTTTDDPSFQTAQAFTTTTTGATANTPYAQTLQLNSTSMTSCAGGNVMNVKISTTAGSTGSSNLQAVAMTFPRLLTVQAN